MGSVCCHSVCSLGGMGADGRRATATKLVQMAIDAMKVQDADEVFYSGSEREGPG